MKTWLELVEEVGIEEALIRATRLQRFIENLDETILMEDFNQYLEQTGWISQDELD